MIAEMGVIVMATIALMRLIGFRIDVAPFWS